MLDISNKGNAGYNKVYGTSKVFLLNLGEGHVII